MNIAVSIIIPLFNAEKYISETIQSVIDQTYKNWELIIIDDGSKDTSSLIVSNYLSDQRIKYYYQENSGVSRARNNGITKALGEYISFLDADDVWITTNLEKKIYILENEPIDFVFSDMELMNEYSTSKNIFMLGSDSNMLNHYLLWDRSVIPGPSSNLILKKKCLIDGLRFDSKFSTAADQDFCINLVAKFYGKRIPQSLWKYRVLSNSMSRNITIMEKDHIGVFHKASINNLFYSPLFKKKCFSNLYLIIAASWWKNGNNKIKGLKYIFYSILTYPPVIFKIIKKI